MKFVLQMQGQKLFVRKYKAKQWMLLYTHMHIKIYINKPWIVLIAIVSWFIPNQFICLLFSLSNINFESIVIKPTWKTRPQNLAFGFVVVSHDET